MDSLNKYLMEQFEILQRLQREAYLAGMENCGHDFWDNAQKAYEVEKDRKAVDGIMSKN